MAPVCPDSGSSVRQHLALVSVARSLSASCFVSLGPAFTLLQGTVGGLVGSLGRWSCRQMQGQRGLCEKGTVVGGPALPPVSLKQGMRKNVKCSVDFVGSVAAGSELSAEHVFDGAADMRPGVLSRQPGWCGESRRWPW